MPKEILNNPTVFVPDDVLDSGKLEGATRTRRPTRSRLQIWEEFQSKIGKK